jgi:hypothetical protein
VGINYENLTINFSLDISLRDMKTELPEIKVKKKIDLKKFTELGKKVRKIWIEEKDYIEKKHGNNPSSEFLIDY